MRLRVAAPTAPLTCAFACVACRALFFAPADTFPTLCDECRAPDTDPTPLARDDDDLTEDAR